VKSVKAIALFSPPRNNQGFGEKVILKAVSGQGADTERF
jgi:hypothetical protein